MGEEVSSKKQAVDKNLTRSRMVLGRGLSSVDLGGGMKTRRRGTGETVGVWDLGGVARGLFVRGVREGGFRNRKCRKVREKGHAPRSEKGSRPGVCDWGLLVYELCRGHGGEKVKSKGGGPREWMARLGCG